MAYLDKTQHRRYALSMISQQKKNITTIKLKHKYITVIFCFIHTDANVDILKAFS